MPLNVTLIDEDEQMTTLDLGGLDLNALHDALELVLTENRRILSVTNTEPFNSLTRDEAETLRNGWITLPFASENQEQEGELEQQLFSASLLQSITKIYNRNCTLKVADALISLSCVKSDGSNGIRNITINRSGEMTFLPKGKKCHLNDSRNAWMTDNRQSGKYGKVLRKVLMENGIVDIDAKELESLCNSLKSIFVADGELVLVKGEDIRTYYHEEKYDYNYNLGTLGSSCMKYEKCQSYFDIYVENEDLCQMLILLDKETDKIRGRALLWTDRDGDKYLDRIYGNDVVISMFKGYAKSQGWIHKVRQSYNDKHEWTLPNGDYVERNVLIDIQYAEGTLPYMDTFSYVSWENHISNSDDYDYDTCANDTDGGGYDDRVWDEYDECYIDEDDSVYIENRDYRTHQDNAMYCDWSDAYYLQDDMIETGCGNYVYQENSHLREDINGVYWHEDDVTLCEITNEYHHNDHIQFISDLGICVNNDDVETAYDNAGWVRNEDNEWVEELEENK